MVMHTLHVLVIKVYIKACSLAAAYVKVCASLYTCLHVHYNYIRVVLHRHAPLF